MAIIKNRGTRWETLQLAQELRASGTELDLRAAKFLEDVIQDRAPRDPKVGTRAFEELLRLSDLTGQSLSSVCSQAGLSRNSAYNWAHGSTPGTLALSAMERAGMDVQYICTGVRLGAEPDD